MNRATIALRRSVAVALVLAMIASAQGQQASVTEGKNSGLDGAAMCLAAGEYLVERGAGTEAIAGANAIWRSIMAVIPSTPDEREKVLANMRKAFDSKDASLGRAMAEAAYFVGCDKRDFQTKYVAKYGSPQLMDAATKGGE